MEIFGIVVLIAIIWYFVKAIASGAKEGYLQPSGGTRPTSQSPTRIAGQAILDSNKGWLRERWKAADRAKEMGNLGDFPKWFFDPVTERQRARLSKMGVGVSGGDLTKGAASDIIGLFEPMDDRETDILKFFKISLPKELQNETRARHEVAAIFGDPEKAKAWTLRPADAMQKEFFRYFGMKAPPGLTHADAQKVITEAHESKSPEDMRGWNDYDSICEELSDPEFLRDVELKKPSLAVIRTAVEEIKKIGESADASDPFEVAEKILEMKPELARTSAR